MGKIKFKDASVIIGCTEGSLRVQYRIWGVPYYKIGSMIRFSESEIYAWIESKSHNKVASIEDISK